MLLLLCFVHLLLSPGDKSEINTLKIYSHARPAIVRITATDRTGHAKVGSGVIVQADGVIATDCHLIQQAARVRVQLNDGRSFDTVTLLGTDAQQQVAFLKIDATALPTLEFQFPDKGNLQHNLFSIGPPMGFGVPLSVGNLYAFQPATSSPMHIPVVVFTAALLPESVGGPLLDEDGNMIGLVAMDKSLESKPAPPGSPQVSPSGLHAAMAGDYLKTAQADILRPAETQQQKTKWEGPGQQNSLRPPAQILASAKSVLVLVVSGKPDMAPRIEEKISKWGGLALAKDLPSADLVLMVTYSGLVRRTTRISLGEPRYFSQPGGSITSEDVEALASLRDAKSGLELWYTTERDSANGKGDFSGGLSKKLIHFLSSEANERK